MQTSQKTDEDTGTLAASGVPGTASNLPRPTSRPGSTGTGVSHHTENITYQTSRTVRHTVHPQGVVKKISVSVLVDQQVRWQGTGAKAKRIIEPPSAEKLKTIKDLLAGVIGSQHGTRRPGTGGDLAFRRHANAEPPPPAASPAPPSKFPPWLAPYVTDPKMLMIGVGAVVGCGAGSGSRYVHAAAAEEASKGSVANPSGPGGADECRSDCRRRPAGVLQHQIQDKLAAQQALQAKAEETALLN